MNKGLNSFSSSDENKVELGSDLNTPNEVSSNTKGKLRKLVGAASIVAAGMVAVGEASAKNDDTSIPYYSVPVEYADDEMRKISPNSVEGEGIYMCNADHVQAGQCIDTDQRYHDAVERQGMGGYGMKIVTYNDTLRGLEYHQALAFDGDFNRGSADAFIRAISSYPDINTVMFNSRGGLIEETKKIASYIKEKGLTTKVIGPWYCVSACSDVVMAGKDIQIDGMVGIHVPSREVYNPKDIPVLTKLSEHLESTLSKLNKRMIEWIDQGGSIDESMHSLVELPSITDDADESTMLSFFNGVNTSISKQITESQGEYISYLLKVARLHESFGGESSLLIKEVLKAKGEFITFSSLDDFKHFSGKETEPFSLKEIKEEISPRVTPGFKLQGIEELDPLRIATDPLN